MFNDFFECGVPCCSAKLKNEDERMKKICIFCKSQGIHIDDVDEYVSEADMDKGAGRIKYTCNNCGRHWSEAG